MEATGLSGRQIENGKKMREVFGTVTEKAIEEEDNIEENNIEEDNQYWEFRQKCDKTGGVG